MKQDSTPPSGKQAPRQQAEATRPQQIGPAPANYGQTDPFSLRQPVDVPNLPTQQLYSQIPQSVPPANYGQTDPFSLRQPVDVPNLPTQQLPQGVPGIPIPPNMQRNVTSTPHPITEGHSWQIPNAPKQMGNFVPPPETPKKKRKKPLPTWARIAVGLLVVLIVVTGGVFVYYQAQIAPALNNILGQQAIHHQNNTVTAPTGRTNILLLGSDTDGKGNDPIYGIPLAQTIMIITVDPRTNYVGMLSIPRDMQVTENGYVAPKLDEVFSHAYTGKNLQDKVASSAGAMEDIIQYNFGIHIDHYAWVGLSGFIKVIDTAGGIDVDTIHPMVDDTYPDDVGNTTGSVYDYKRLSIAPGPQHLNGMEALNYVRTRHSDLIGDFGRTVRQQQVIGQLKTKLATPDTLGKASELLQDLSGAVQTDMQLSDIIGLGNLARSIDSNTTQHLTLGPPDYAVPNTNGPRTSNYLPVCTTIVPAIQKMFNINSPNCVSPIASNSSNVSHTSKTTSAPIAFNIADNTAKNSRTANMGADPLTAGVHGLLDMLFATTFESFDAMQI